MIDEIAESLGLDTVFWYPDNILTCGSGFRLRYLNDPVSLAVTYQKLRKLKDQNIDSLLHMCPNCQLQFDRYQPFIEEMINENFGIFHLNISQLIALALGADPYKVVGIQTHSVSLEPLLKRLGLKINRK